MNIEKGLDLTKLGSGVHEPITGFPHAEMPLLSEDQTPITGLTIGQPVKNGVIMQYLQERPTDHKPIVDTTAVDPETGETYSQKLLASNI